MSDGERREGLQRLEDKVDDLTTTVENLVTVVRENKEKIESVQSETKGMVEAWTAAHGAIKVAAFIGKVAAFIGSIAVVKALMGQK